MIQMNLFTKQTHRYRKQIMITKGEREVKGKIRSLGLADTNYHI